MPVLVKFFGSLLLYGYGSVKSRVLNGTVKPWLNRVYVPWFETVKSSRNFGSRGWTCANLNLGENLRSWTVKLFLSFNATSLEERRRRCGVMITEEAQNRKECRGSCVWNNISERCTGSAQVALNHTYSAGETYRMKNGTCVAKGQARDKNKLGFRGNPKHPRVNLLRAVFRVNHCGLLNYPTNRNSDRSNVRTRYQAKHTGTRMFSVGIH